MKVEEVKEEMEVVMVVKLGVVMVLMVEAGREEVLEIVAVSC